MLLFSDVLQYISCIRRQKAAVLFDLRGELKIQSTVPVGILIKRLAETVPLGQEGRILPCIAVLRSGRYAMAAVRINSNGFMKSFVLLREVPVVSVIGIEIFQFSPRKEEL